jgi:hypothetical protein
VRAIWRRADSGDELRIRQLRAVYGDRISHWRFMRAEHYVSAAGAEGAQEKLLKYEARTTSLGSSDAKRMAVANNARTVSRRS